MARGCERVTNFQIEGSVVTDIKVELKNMKHETQRKLLADYNIVSIRYAMHELSGGAENTNYRIVDGDKEFVLRVYNPSHSIKGLGN